MPTNSEHMMLQIKCGRDEVTLERENIHYLMLAVQGSGYKAYYVLDVDQAKSMRDSLDTWIREKEGEAK